MRVFPLGPLHVLERERGGGARETGRSLTLCRVFAMMGLNSDQFLWVGQVKTLPLSDAKARLSELVEEVTSRDEVITITRNGRPVAVLVSPDEFESWKETVAVRSDPELMEEIRRGLRALKRGAKLYSLDELFGD